MSQPARLVLTLVLVWGTATPVAAAQVERAVRKRSVVVATNPTDALPVVRVARDTPTVLLFPAPINRKTLTFDESRIHVLDAGERSVIVQPVADLAEGERYEVGVFFADGRAPARAAFSLVTDPAEVDIQINVQRPELAGATCPVDEPRAPSPEDFVLLGLVDKEGVSATPIKRSRDATQGISVVSAIAYRGNGWVLVDADIRNEAGHSPWTPRVATLTGRVGLPLKARIVQVDSGAIPAGGYGRVLIATETSQLSASPVFTLEIVGDGRTLTLPNVRLPKAASARAP
ncbi:hypothetical protein MXAN_1232 [Myxococcus xanthus DK 1622]|uniref:DUF2381 family protein n=1 Tax=Myxococcus xanthus (strain DK1622) TaxID=246197 RepID=Q1DCY2_MYXXD|nr:MULTISPECIES: DUF2381 family protein [Myxococcus]ABF90476.1 hypothetical protein MXAN_1232 [Myxococcus xanthus DK 1622]NOJ53453.1 DUF2381 family protein [Myxococcus xanthus]QPM80877.1 DUF2381 family protein [Myxococcus xanthus]QVW69937.1 DUF2381 family protein [Myxococcus xanthus DZ2]QZZ48761.1 hypothetical protein MyxoNM_06075 [Myxococcus xanthus]